VGLSPQVEQKGSVPIKGVKQLVAQPNIT
jgi:hypothetical protein